MKFVGVQGHGSGPLRLRYQFAGAILVVLIPYVLMLIAGPTTDYNTKLLTTTGVYSVLAALLGVMLLRSVSHYPGVEGVAYLLPSFGISFGALLAVLILARLPYSRFLLFSSFFLALVCFMATYVLVGRRRTFVIGVVPGGDHELLPKMRGIDWIVLGTPSQDTGGMHAITADLRIDLPPEWDRRLADFALAGMPVYHTKHLMESLTGMVQLEHLSENSFGTLAPVSSFMTTKHVVDWLVAALAAVLLTPFLLLLALAIRLDSPGPAIFRQIRIGYQGRPFTVYKFRTMRVATTSSELDAAKTKAEDSRITRIGAALRRSRIDELPQILNILKGEMSWIGPRPEAQVLSQWYEDEISFYRYRHIVRPGLTGWAQVNQGHVAEVSDVREKLFFDFYYIKNYSPWMDLLIVARTIQTVLTGFGAK